MLKIFLEFDEPIKGPVLMERMRRQTERFGTRFVDESITEVDFSSLPLKIRTESSKCLPDSVIIATGALALWLGLESERRLKGRGVSSCATCDGFFFKGKDVAVVGGGNTTIEEALFLSKLTSLCESYSQEKRVTPLHCNAT